MIFRGRHVQGTLLISSTPQAIPKEINGCQMSYYISVNRADKGGTPLCRNARMKEAVLLQYVLRDGGGGKGEGQQALGRVLMPDKQGHWTYIRIPTLTAGKDIYNRI